MTRASASNGHRVPKPDATRAHYTESQHTRRTARCGTISHESESHEARSRLERGGLPREDAASPVWVGGFLDTTRTARGGAEAMVGAARRQVSGSREQSFYLPLRHTRTTPIGPGLTLYITRLAS